MAMRHELFALAAAAVFALAGPLPASGRQVEQSEVAAELSARAEAQAASGDTTGAVATYEELVQLEPRMASAYVAWAALLSRQGDATAAADVLERGLAAVPDHRDLLYNAAVLAVGRGDAGAAEPLLARAAKVAARDPAIPALRATALRQLGRSTEALAAIDAAIALAPEDARYHYARGNLLHALDRKADAAEAFRRATRLDRGMFRAYANLGAVELELGHVEAALEAYARAVEPIDEALAAGRPVEAASARVYANLGAIHTQRRDFAAAVSAYRKAMRIEDGNALHHYNAGYAAFQLGKTDEALVAYEQALARDADLPLAYLHIGTIRAGRGEHAAAVDWLSRAIPRLGEAERPAALRLLATSQIAVGDPTGAEQSLHAALAQQPADGAAQLILGRLLRQRGALAEAGAWLERAREADPGNPAVTLELATLARARGELGLERRLLGELAVGLRGRPEVLAVQASLALANLRAGDLAAARSELEALLARGAAGLDRELALRLRTTLALLQANAGNFGSADRELGAVLRERPDFTAAIAARALLGALRGDAAKAATALAPLVSGAAGEAAADDLLRGNLALLRWQLGETGVRATLEPLAERYPRWASVRLATGALALAGGEVAGAIAHLEAARRDCRDPVVTLGEGSAATMRVPLGSGTAGGGLCPEVDRHLGVALLAAASAALAAPGGNARGLADRALALPLEDAERAAALYVRGTAALAAGDDAAARTDLERAVRGPLPTALAAAARNNLGVALANAAQHEAALGALEQARAERLPAAALNLALLLDRAERSDARRIRQLLLDYQAAGGTRREAVSPWIEQLGRLTP